MDEGKTITAVAREVGIRTQRLLSWEENGIIKPLLTRHGKRVVRLYTPEITGRIVKIKAMVDQSYTLRSAAALLNSQAGIGGAR